MESVHHVSVSSKILFSKVRKIVPPMLETFHKGLLIKSIEAINQKSPLIVSLGQLGRVAVIGGCVE